MSSEEAEMLPPAAVAALPLDDDNLLSEILLRLPPLPSSLPRASAVCRRWRSLASDPAFSRRFRLHHRRNPPLLGCFYGDYHQIHFEPTLEPPNRVPPRRLSLQADVGDRFWPLGSRHGLVLIFNETRLQFLVWDPVTGHQHCIAIPREFDRIKAGISGAVLRSAARDIHFKVVLAVANDDNTVLASVYSSETRVWGNLITSIPFWKFFRPKSESLAFIQMPVDRINVPCYTPMRADDGELGLLSLTFTTAQLWKRKIDCDGTAPWGVARTIELDKLLSLDSGEPTWIQGFAEDKNLVSLCAGNSNFTVQLESLEFKKPSNPRMDRYFPFESVYAAGI
ncbi:uncharacterized protein LOC119326651 isoform X2 [Triticum dicoccoides]|uniref:uncharacterized protein LOC119326651 isoform X2 n=1 Tax=Triticum dicoccoides TaxID=85692 RepID=UPI0018916F41|nr:uncharacterized protein LOC119326651 isoform X2 [Triticum dicoccoides]